MRAPSLATLFAAVICQVALVSQPLAAPPEGKGKSSQSSQGGGNGNGKSKNQGNGNGKNNGQSNGSHSNKSSNSKGGNNGKGGHGGGDSDVNVSLSYAGITVSTARGYAVDYGATRYTALPPGIRKNLARGKPLPPGIAKKMVPGPMLAHLPVHPGYEWQVAGTDLILVAIGTAIIADVLFDVFD
ncbi:anti-virulence regulator CigR family protein [Bordetella muralis]|jgi:hypothetical protein|uniref:anti-virulence regulator CigR family protein n=1 Tax=Bordetella muralis TaxID=1649130 RepID=UPI0039F0406C